MIQMGFRERWISLIMECIMQFGDRWERETREREKEKIVNYSDTSFFMEIRLVTP
jgi:hypothetical protein